MILQGLWIQLAQIAPYWLSGLAVGSVINVYLSDRIIARFSAFQEGRFSVIALLVSAALGIISPICMFGTVPVIVSLGRKNVPEYLLAAFMVCSILLNPSLALMTLALGTHLAVLRLCVSMLGGLLAGIVVYFFFKKKPLYRFDAFEVDTKKKKRALWRDFLRALSVTAPYFFAGILLTALYDLYFPKDLMNIIFAGNIAFGTLFAMSLSIPLHACGGGAIPLLLAWLREGMSNGAALAFMVAGPAVKFTNLGAVKTITGVRHFVFYLLFCSGFALVAGLITDGITIVLSGS